jgi:hypothetical protein
MFLNCATTNLPFLTSVYHLEHNVAKNLERTSIKFQEKKDEGNTVLACDSLHVRTVFPSFRFSRKVLAPLKQALSVRSGVEHSGMAQAACIYPR